MKSGPRYLPRRVFTWPFVLALVLALIFSLPATYFPQSKTNFPLSSQATKVLVDSLANQLSKYYVEKDAALQMSAYLRSRLKEGAYSKIADPHQLAGLLTDDVTDVYKDEHLHIEYNPILANEVSGNIDDVPKMVAEKLKNDRAKNFGFKKVEVLYGNIGYLELSGFSRLNQYSRETANNAMRLLCNSNALIIDLRYGVGGSPEMMTHIISHFFKEKTHVSDIYIRSENATLPYYTIPDSSTTHLTDVPIYVLTSYKTFSAAEGLAFALKSLHRATIVGEATRGGAHTVTYRPLSSGFVADIPFGKAFNPINKETWERHGITPDVKVSADKALEVAEELIFENALSKTKDSAEVRNLKWNRDLLRSINHPYSADSTQLKEYAGRYGVYTLSYNNGELYYQKIGKARFPVRAMDKDWLRPRSNDSFKVQMLRDEKGLICGMLTLYDDGRREQAGRLKRP